MWWQSVSVPSMLFLLCRFFVGPLLRYKIIRRDRDQVLERELNLDLRPEPRPEVRPVGRVHQVRD